MKHIDALFYDIATQNRENSTQIESVSKIIEMNFVRQWGVHLSNVFSEYVPR